MFIVTMTIADFVQKASAHGTIGGRQPRPENCRCRRGIFQFFQQRL
jgi:hypothetical protein